MKFRTRPQVVEAVQYTGEMTEELQALTAGDPVAFLETCPPQLGINTLSGLAVASPGDWIVRGPNGQLFPCTPQVFAERYEQTRADHDRLSSLLNVPIANTDDCMALAGALSLTAKRCGARGVLVAVSIERDGHSDYGVCGRGPCLEVEGLGARVEHYVSKMWSEAERPPEIPPPGRNHQIVPTLDVLPVSSLVCMMDRKEIEMNRRDGYAGGGGGGSGCGKVAMGAGGSGGSGFLMMVTPQHRELSNIVDDESLRDIPRSTVMDAVRSLIRRAYEDPNEG